MSLLSPSVSAERPRRNLEQERARHALARLGAGADLLAAASAVQAALGCVPPVTHDQIAAYAGSTPEAVRELVAGTGSLGAAPDGRRRVRICTGRTCARRGGARLLRQARHALGVDPFQTTSDGAIRLEAFCCFGQCAMAPNVQVDGRLCGAMTPERFGLLLDVWRRGAAGG